MPRKRLKAPLRISEVLEDAVKRWGLDVEPQQNKIWTLWSEVVGPRIGARAQPARLREGCLFVWVEDSMWLHQLSFLKQNIVIELNRRLGRTVLKDIVMRVGEVKGPAARRQGDGNPLGTRPRLSIGESLPEKHLREILSPVRGEDCQEALERILRLHFRGVDEPPWKESNKLLKK